MTTNTQLEQVKAEGNRLLEQIKQVIHEGNVRRIIITQANGDVVAEFPLTIGVIGTVFAPVVAAIGAIVALLAECHIYIERVETTKPVEPVKTVEPLTEEPDTELVATN